MRHARPHGGHTRLKGWLKKYHKKLVMKHIPGPTPLRFTTINGKRPSNGKWKKKNIAHLKCYNPKGHSYGWSLASSSFESQDISRPVMAPFNGVFCRKPFFPEKNGQLIANIFLFDKYEACVGATPILLPAINGHHCWQPPPIQPPSASQTTKTHNGQKVYKHYC